MSRNYSLYLQDIAEAIDRIQSYLEGVARDEFETNQMRLDAVIRNLIIVDEFIAFRPHTVMRRDIEMREVHLFPRFEDNLRAFVRGRSFKCFLNLTHRENIADEQVKER